MAGKETSSTPCIASTPYETLGPSTLEAGYLHDPRGSPRLHVVLEGGLLRAREEVLPGQLVRPVVAQARRVQLRQRLRTGPRVSGARHPCCTFLPQGHLLDQTPPLQLQEQQSKRRPHNLRILLLRARNTPAVGSCMAVENEQCGPLVAGACQRQRKGGAATRAAMPGAGAARACCRSRCS